MRLGRSSTGRGR